MLFGIQAGLLGNETAEIERSVILGAALTLIWMLGMGGIYVFTRWPVHWRTMLATMYLTSALFALAYVVIERETLLWLLPRMSDELLADTARRAAMGGITGFIAGVIIGLCIPLIDSQASRFSRTGIVRYSLIYVIMAGGLGLAALLNMSGAVDRHLSGVAAVALAVGLKFGFDWWNRRHPQRE